MSTLYASYRLQNGYIHHWLVAGPQAIPLPDPGGLEDRAAVARHYYDESSGIVQAPVERDSFKVGGTSSTWVYSRCLDDRFVDLSSFHHTCHYLRAWAYAQVSSPSAQKVTFILTTNGPADFWLNGQHMHRQEHFCRIPRGASFSATVREGRNEILVRFEQVAVRECPHSMALQVIGLPDHDVAVLLPTSVKALARRQTLEQAFEEAYLDRDLYTRDDEITVQWPDGLGLRCELIIRLMDLSGRIYVEARPLVEAGTSVQMVRCTQIPAGPYRAVLMPKPEEYYEGNMRVQKRIGLWVQEGSYSQTTYGAYPGRRIEALQDAARREAGIFSEIAKMELARWSDVNPDVIRETIEGINQRRDCSDYDLVGLLGMIHRYIDNPLFPEELKPPLEKCVLDFRYWMDEPGSDGMCYWSEHHQILFHTCEILAGQLFPDRSFVNVGKRGKWHRQKGERMALRWLVERGRSGFREWDSNYCFEKDLLALAHLADLAEHTEVRELAAILMDKMFFTIALNSYQGVFGSTQGHTFSHPIKSAHLEPTAGITRLMWGMGTFSQHTLGTVSLACAKEYELPPIIPDVAADLPEEMWARERHAGKLEEWCDRATGSWEVNKVTYKTPDYMLCSAQDYRPGDKGNQEHIWQATMGPDAVVFVTHPPHMSEQAYRRPNFWHGNHVLPRVAQWRDVLIAVHRLPENDWMGFTHAYFPVYAFAEHALRDGWAFARKGKGYLALTAAQGLALTTRGHNAYRELRSYGDNNVWLCHTGRAARDGSFREFQEKVLALDVDFMGLSVRCVNLRGETLAFGWEGPLSVNGREQPITGFRHYENPYCVADLPVSQMEIRFGDWLLRLDFAT